MKMLAIIGLSLATAFTGVMPAQAFPSIERPKLQISDVQQVESYRSSWGIGRYGGNRRYIRRHYRDRSYYSHRRHYRDYGHRRYYRDYDDNFGAALGGLAAGAIIGGLLAQPRYYGGQRYYRSSGSHADWCYARYRSYRAYDNTYQPYYGRRRQCVSPY
ncbi:BA14K family protein [Pararhizobium sp. YC-54]|uniref:BA14K family protein n=1 Tax=Pararhizobium sp. YC-54 TaxID=2986920 RepID=UPI0021F6D15C|nr:BA14K family protein [Pararhizobium sp. YC-54]MCV9997846.1 BA14K family protein [Pararhizobium sp. YC-54]